MEPTATPEAAVTTNGKPEGNTVEVHNPATGALIGSVPAMTPDEVTEAVARARAAQPAWEALGFAERGRILRRMQKWTLDNSERIISTIVAENGKTYEDAQLAEVSYAASAFGFWAKNAPDFLADEKVKSASPFVIGRKLVVRYAPVVPLAGASTRFQPVWVEDVARVVDASLEDAGTIGRSYDLCGPKAYTLAEIVTFVAAQAGLARVIVPLPRAIATLQAMVLERLPGPVMTRDNLRSMEAGSVCGCPFPPRFGFAPAAMEAIVPQYMRGENPRARYDAYRQR